MIDLILSKLNDHKKQLQASNRHLRLEQNFLVLQAVEIEFRRLFVPLKVIKKCSFRRAEDGTGCAASFINFNYLIHVVTGAAAKDSPCPVSSDQLCY